MKQLLYPILAAALCLGACTKGDFLNKKPRTNLVVPSTLTDFQALLDNDIMNQSPAMGEITADNFYVKDGFQQTMPLKDLNTVLWKTDIYEGTGNVEDWNTPYKQVFTANVVLEGIQKLPVSADWEHVKGSALFYRAHAFYQLATVFAAAYDATTAKSDLGIPLKLASDVNENISRGNLQQTFDRILTDLHEAVNLLSADFPATLRNRPSRPAAMALLSRVYLYMRDYERAGLYADSSLQLYNKLIDYNAVASALFPFTRLNDETLFQCRLTTNYVLLGIAAPGTIIDSNLYKSYTTGDLRPSLFFRASSAGGWSLGGSYNQSVNPFSGLATDEVYLNRAECYARAGKINEAISDLNTLRAKRFAPSSYVALSATTKEEALAFVLAERRKELPFRSTRFTDLKRLNKEGYNIHLKRISNGQTYELVPNDPRYVMPIPPDEINITGIPQNQR
ncbi:RagB/SusD family nutrient uptake outer membrane protein [Chitinophaga horti]|uniref:RagB/SusD family nutrient uptake outer membrane protein n=1 Tax=Chitinophaga horti TaxID=2920382 RepID=A0ABY6J5B5_9BACT|nr:RagB/SusD family nutrient uptake outer membrane protein [Chitinophaga horti]UYQ94812.1 RagB/SusD family nutrient uptake outer membrane protein [Chitinophaga horti]